MRRKLRIVRLILTEIAVMSLGVMCCVMPMPWRLIVPIIIGTRSILIKARLQLKQPLPPAPAQSKQRTKTKGGKKANAEEKQCAEQRAAKNKVKGSEKKVGKKADGKKANNP